MKRNEKMLKQEKKWITDGERILFGPGQCYKICHVHRISIALQVIGALLVILTGSGVMIKDPNMGYMGSLAGFAVFLYGLHLNGIARAAGMQKEPPSARWRKRWKAIEENKYKKDHPPEFGLAG